MASVLMVIEPYWYQDTWVFDDTSKGLEKEPLDGIDGELEELQRWLSGTSEMINYLVKDIPNARSGFMLLLSSQPFAGYQVELTRVTDEELDKEELELEEEYGGCSYEIKDWRTGWWLSPALCSYFENAPESLYVKAEPRRDKYDLVEDVVALKDRIEGLEQLVGKLTLENEALREGRNKPNDIA